MKNSTQIKIIATFAFINFIICFTEPLKQISAIVFFAFLIGCGLVIEFYKKKDD